jgi:uncharacterized protein YjbI with pentapeptide repeats
LESNENPILYSGAEILQHIAEITPKKLVVPPKRKTHDEASQGVRNHTFKKYHFTGKFDGFIFKGCKFIECTFENIWGFFHYFKKCEFTGCTFRNSRFSHGQFGWTELVFFKCYFRNVEIDEGDLDNSIFQDCEISGLRMAEDVFNVEFLDCRIEDSQFRSIVYYPPDVPLEEAANDVIFTDCNIIDTYFTSIDFRNSRFNNCSLYFCVFQNCTIANQTITIGDKKLQPVYASMDFQTILKSDISDIGVLQQHFNIHIPDYKSRISEMSTKMEYKKIFISYSFKDQIFARALNEVLKKNGVKTFLWENDAPGGQYLEDIMSKNVYNHDIMLFIASEHSLKSKACQFELSTGRKKQEETWQNVFFSVHIDNYLFEVKQNQIRPIDKAEEYWKNIEELKRVNSQDFSSFSKMLPEDLKSFELAVVQKIVTQLQPA